MKLTQITLAKVLEATNWTAAFSAGPGEEENPDVREANSFTPDDQGLFSAVLRMNDGSEHAALIVKSFPDGGLHTQTWVHTKVGWVNVFAEGFMRAVGRYPGDVFPYEIYIGKPWMGDKELAKEGASKIQEHISNFEEAVERLRAQMAKR